MKKILFFICLTLTISCSNDDDNKKQNSLTYDYRKRVETWKLVSIKNDSGNEIANNCQLQNSKIILKYDPKNSDAFQQELADITEGKTENQECQTTTNSNIQWAFSSEMGLYFPNNETHYYYCYSRVTENGNRYLSLTTNAYMTIGEDSEYEDFGYGFLDEPITRKYILESEVFPE